jgi:hypothetical protein
VSWAVRSLRRIGSVFLSHVPNLYRLTDFHEIECECYCNVIGKVIPVTGRGDPIGLWDVEDPTFSLDNRLTDGGEVK